MHLKVEHGMLWVDHFYLTRQVIRDAVAGSVCLGAELNELLKNQENIGNNFAEMTRHRDAGNVLTVLLKQHIQIAVEIVKAAIAGQSIDNLNAQWKNNGNEIAACYHKYNYHIPYEEMSKMMQDHLKTTLDEAVAIIQKNCDQSVVKGDIALAHLKHMAHYINSKFM